MKQSVSTENYIKAILLLQVRQGEVRSVDVARELGVSKPSVSVAVKKLQGEGLAGKDENGGLFLTESGQAYAAAVLERHTVIETLLVFALGVDAKTAHEDACRMEHLVSPETFTKMKEKYEKAIPAAGPAIPFA